MQSASRCIGVLFALASTCAAIAQTPPAATPPVGEGTQQPAPAKPADAGQQPAAPKQDAAKAQGPADARGATPAAEGSAFTKEQLEQIAAPIALHPDALLAHILMGATYPLEIVEAARWIEKNPKLTGKALEDALKQQEWDPAVKALCGFPTVIKQMSENLDWTQDLGDAFLGQKKELMDTVQSMRRKALESGNLKTTEQQKVSDNPPVIVIESASPEVIYVPTYSPTVVYGGWSYPYYYYPPMYAPYPPGAGFITFTAGVVWGAAVWGNCNWGGSDVDIDIDHHNEFNRNTDREPKRNEMDKRGDKGQFKHDPEHRKGVNYKSKDVANKMGASPGQSRVTRDQARGFDRGGASASQRPSGGASAANRPASGASTRPSTTPSRGSSSTGASTRSGNSGALSGSRSPSIDRSASSRGAASRASSASRGGMSRGGASRGGGGGRRR